MVVMIEPLTPRELQVLKLARDGLDNPAIGARLCITAKAVGYHLTHIYGKLGTVNRMEAVITALKIGLIGFED